MSKLKTIVVAALGALIVFVLGTFVLASTKPSDFRYERTLGINAQPEKIFTLVNDYHSWASWSPWEKLDPAMKKLLTAPLPELAPFTNGKETAKWEKVVWKS